MRLRKLNLILLCLIGILILCLFLRKREEGFEDGWLVSYNEWKKEYMARRGQLCPLFTKVDTILSKAGEPSLDALNKTPVIGTSRDGKPLVNCSDITIPESPSVENALAFFSKFPEEAEVILLRSVKLLHPILKEQLDKIKKVLSDVPELPPTTKQGFEDAGKFFGNSKKPAVVAPEDNLTKLKNTIQKHADSLLKTGPDFTKLLKEASGFMAEMDKIKDQAQNGTLPMPQIG